MIARLTGLGRALGYFVIPEWPIHGSSSGAAVDVAWFLDAADKFPMMIFEVESSPSTGMVNNAVKVFSKPVETLLKPLFYFHLVLSGTVDSERVDNLRQLFGTHNYRVYTPSKEQQSAALLDILSQHRRIRSQIDLSAVISELCSGGWDKSAVEPTLRALRHLDFRASYLQTYARGATLDSTLKQQFIEALAETIFGSKPLPFSDVQYERPFYWAHWELPIHLGILATNLPDKRADCFHHLREWQLHSYHISQIGPHWGLSRDYDECVALASASFWALVAALFCNTVEARKFIAEQMKPVFMAVKNHDRAVAVFHAIWLFHVAGGCGLEELATDAFSLMQLHGVRLDELQAPDALVDISPGRNRVSSEAVLENDFLLTAQKMHDIASKWDGYQPDSIAISLLGGLSPQSWQCSIVRSLWRPAVERL